MSIPQGAAAANACIAKGGIGGTGYVPDGGGVGGTGAPPDGGIGGTGAIAKGGIGGTGAIAKGGIGGTGFATNGVGVVGTITGFASLCVNGLEVHYAAGTPVSANGLPASTSDLAVGQVVTIEASNSSGKPGDELAGVKVSILNAVTGPIRSLDASTRRLEVLGQVVRVTRQTLIADVTGIKDFDFLRAGGLVRVSGLRLANGDIVASRIETVLTLAQASVLGPVTQSDADGFSIYGLRVENADLKGAAGVSGEVMVSGRLDGTTLRPERIAMSPSLSFAQGIDRLVLEGYIGSRTDTQLVVGGVKVTVSASTSISGDLQPNYRVTVIGRLLPDNSVLADTILLRRDPLTPPSAASIMPPPLISRDSRSLLFGRDARFGDGSDGYDNRGAGKFAASPTGATTTGTASGTTVGINNGTNGTLGGGGGDMGGGGTITPGGGNVTPGGGNVKVIVPVVTQNVFKFDALDFKLMGGVRPGKR